MTINRRRFIQLIGAAVVAVKMPALASGPSLASSPPLLRLVGDGIHNDAPALNALYRGETVEIGPQVDFRGAGWVDNTLTLPSGRFFMQSPLYVQMADDVTINGNGAVLTASISAESCIHIDNCKNLSLFGVVFAREGSAGMTIPLRFDSAGYFTEAEGAPVEKRKFNV